MVPVAGLASRRQSTTSFGDKDAVRLDVAFRSINHHYESNHDHYYVFGVSISR